MDQSRRRGEKKKSREVNEITDEAIRNASELRRLAGRYEFSCRRLRARRLRPLQLPPLPLFSFSLFCSVTFASPRLGFRSVAAPLILHPSSAAGRDRRTGRIESRGRTWGIVRMVRRAGKRRIFSNAAGRRGTLEGESIPAPPSPRSGTAGTRAKPGTELRPCAVPRGAELTPYAQPS